MAHERIQSILGLEMQEARKAVDWKRFGAIKNVAKAVARLNARGMLTVDAGQLEAATRVERFTDQERKGYEDDGAFIYLPKGETIRGQKAVRPLWLGTEGYVEEDGKNRLLDFPPRRIEVAIWADPKDPEKLFVPGSFDKNTDQQDKLRLKDAENLAKRLGFPVNLIRPEAPEVTEVMQQHFNETGVCLLGEDWIKDGYWRYIRTGTPTNKSGSSFASVGYFSAGGGPDVDDWSRDKSRVYLGDARWAVPNRFR